MLYHLKSQTTYLSLKVRSLSTYHHLQYTPLFRKHARLDISCALFGIYVIIDCGFQYSLGIVNIIKRGFGGTKNSKG